MADQVNDSTQILSSVENININEKCKTDYNCDNDSNKWGLPMTEVYKLALSFYKEKEGKAVQLSYEDKLQLIAFAQQVNHGPLSGVISKLPPLGALDVVGHDRRLAWERLGNLSPAQGRSGFVELLSRRCALLSAHIEAHRREKEEKERLAKEAAHQKLIELEEHKQKAAEQQKIQEQLEKEEAIKRQIQQALNEQTYAQFRTYAEQQFPGEPERQGALVRQLQEQHYFQYMQQLQASPHSEPIHESSTKLEEADTSDDQLPSAASMWTRSEIQTFKQSVAQAEGDGVVRVGHGETVTVRVPTHREGSRLFWEFATDHYDIGFGVYFEWGVPSTDQVSVHVSESEDDEEEDADDEGLDDELIHAGSGDIEAGSGSITRPLLSEIVPVFRRDCQIEVYAGSHSYPGQGVYLLKFDNSYSLWRSKTLYYRVYYTH